MTYLILRVFIWKFLMYIIENIFGNGFKQNALILISALSIISGILVIVSKNPVKSVLFLIGLFLTIALYLFVINMSFIALAYLLVYVGAVSILFLFILMLINVRVSELSTDNNNSIPLSIIIITIFSITFSSKSLFSTNNENLALFFNTGVEKNIAEHESLQNLFFIKDKNEDIYLVFSSMWDNILGEMSHMTSLGNILYVSYSLGIIIVGLILLLSMVGAISITATSKDRT